MSTLGSSCVVGPGIELKPSSTEVPVVNTDVSMPLENARPSPITTSARMPCGSSTSDEPSSDISRHIAIVNELSLSGRLSRNHPTAPSRSRRRVEVSSVVCIARA
jgi:hypothetical protein